MQPKQVDIELAYMLAKSALGLFLLIVASLVVMSLAAGRSGK